MRKVRSSNTAPELLVRRLLHLSGFRFKLTDQKLPGRPDIILPKYKTVIMVHGCFWHRHRGCGEAAMPGSNVKYWSAKFERNRLRDRRIARQLRQMGWRVIVVWECQTKNPVNLLKRLKRELIVPTCYKLASRKDLSFAAEDNSKYKAKTDRCL